MNTHKKAFAGIALSVYMRTILTMVAISVILALALVRDPRHLPSNQKLYRSTAVIQCPKPGPNDTEEDYIDKFNAWRRSLTKFRQHEAVYRTLHEKRNVEGRRIPYSVLWGHDIQASKISISVMSVNPENAALYANVYVDEFIKNAHETFVVVQRAQPAKSPVQPVNVWLLYLKGVAKGAWIGLILGLIVGTPLFVYKISQTRVIAPKYETFGARVSAGILDGLVLLPLSIPMIVVEMTSKPWPAWALILVHVLTPLASYAYSILMHGRYGQTLGKMWAGVKILDVGESKPITYFQALKRDAVPLLFFIILLPVELHLIQQGEYGFAEIRTSPWHRILGSLMWGWWGLEILTMLFSRKRRAVHDIIAGTVVVNRW